MEDDDDLELEPVDPEILEHARRRILDKSRKAEHAVDIDAIYAEQDNEPLSLDVDLLKQFRFTTKHLLWATALLAVGLTLLTQLGPCPAIFIVMFAAVGGGWWAVIRHQERESRRRRQQRAAIEARIRAEQQGESPPADAAEPIDEATSWREAFETEEPIFNFSFSMKEMFAAFTVAAILLAVVGFSTNLPTLAMLLGFIAVAGIAVSASGIEPPRVVVLCWWLLLVMYLIVGVAAAVGVG